MNKLRFFILFTACAFFLAACTGDAGHSHEEGDHDHAAGHSNDKSLSLTPLSGSPDFSEATLDLKTKDEEGGELTLEFEVENYELGAQTTPAQPNGLANSGKGQHIHLIVDNGPYSAHYEPTATTDKLKEPGTHVVLAFLSRSYHESVKNMDFDASSFVIEQFQVGDDAEPVDLSEPHMFYSRPKGTYKGSDTEKLLLDFFLLNVDLSPDGNKVRATINGEEFIITEWQPYVVEGLPMGEITVKLELIDADGDAIPGPFNTVERKVTLAPADSE